MELIDTEEKAKKRWCPEARIALVGGVIGVTVNKHPEIRTRCIGSECMMFRYDGNTSQFYCGKAGKP